MNNLEPIYGLDLSILESIKDIQQARTNFQIENFVINQHVTDPMRYKQCLLEIESIYFALRNLDLDIEIENIKKIKLLESKDDIDALEAAKCDLKLEQMALKKINLLRELETLKIIFKSFKKKYTRKEIEDNQKEYWINRLTRQYQIENISKSAGQTSLIQTLIDMGQIEYVPLENSKNENIKEIE